ncbi:MAG: hypothetical protein VX871_07520 [Pseudomonadota bacterium]|nr:hypothetical protein [Pseudomonadota bacterium]
MSGGLKWRRAGLVVEPQPKLWWWQTHCMVPTPQVLSGSLCRLYFSGRDNKNRSHVGWAVLDLAKDGAIVDLAEEPVLSPGELGCFDDNGVTPSCVLHVGDRLHLYYIGWNPGSTTRMNIFGGLAVSEDGGQSFSRWSRAPILERCKSDPFINTAPFVIPDSGGYRIYYVSGVGWDDPDSPRYLIKTATSKDGKRFERDGTTAIGFDGPAETALARPYVVREGGLYRMWFSAKGQSYQFAYAESDDGVNWTRKPEPSGLGVSASGFDSQMVEYAVVVRHSGRSFMFYNGNNYGHDGIGMAIGE